MKNNNQNNNQIELNENNKLMKTSVYITKNEMMYLKRLKYVIFEQYDINVSLNRILKGALKDYMNTYFPPNEPLKDVAMDYVYSQEDLKEKLENKPVKRVDDLLGD